MKKLISIVIVLSVAVGLAGPINALTTAELQAQIAALTAQLAQLQAQLTSLGGTGTVPAACAGISSFATSLTEGSSGNDVRCLQALLNQSADTQVAASGVGSAGNETTYFGGLTKAAVVKFQTKYAISPAVGYVGPITRAQLNPMLVGTPGTPGTPATPGTCSGTEGSYTVQLSTSPVSRTVNGGMGIEAYGVDVTAYNSDITVGSFDLQTAVTVAAVAWNPSTFINAIKVYRGSVSDANLVKTVSSPVFTLDTAGVYYTSLTGLNLVVPVGTTQKVLIVLDTVESSDNNRVVTLNVYGNGIRGRDCIGIDRFTALATTRILTIQPASGNATLTVTAASDNPNSQNIQSNTTNGVSTDTPILSFNAKAQSGSVTLTRVSVLYATGASEAIPSVLLLKQGGVLVSSCTPGTEACVFENFRTPVAAEETKKFTVEANWTAMTDTSMNAFQGINIPAAVNGIVYERSNGAQIGTAGAVLAAALTGNTQFVFESGLKVTLVSATATGGTVASTSAGTATGTFRFNVQPFGGTLTQFANATPSTETINAFFAEAYWASGSAVAASADIADCNVTRVLAQNPTQNITDGGSAVVDLTMTVTSTTSEYIGALRFNVHGVQWTVGNNNIYQGEFHDADNKGANFTDTWFTNWVNLQ